MKLPSWLTNNSWMNNVNIVAQFGHSSVPFSYLMVLDKYKHNRLFWAVAAGTIVYAAAKEFWYDANYETPKQTFGNNLTDFSFYMLGVGLAILVHTI